MVNELRIDHVLLNVATSSRDVDRLIAALIEERSRGDGLSGIVVPPVFAKRAVDALRSSGIRVASVAGYPLGLAKSTIKAIEATSLAKDGVDAIEVTPLAANLLGQTSDEGFAAFRAELLEIVRGIKAARPATTVHVRLDLEVFQIDSTNAPALATAIVTGACDGVVFESRSLAKANEVLAVWPAMLLDAKLVGIGFDASKIDCARLTAIGNLVAD